ncbi:MAG TPA: sensor histidine kinase [Solirubrobacteraceae bacterium]|jgi:signal transduction histidine kinase|nr:sensor histidine kinase [Solirubrobacteraceae bacterium]
MLFPARMRSVRIRGFDRVRVDELIGFVLLIEIELQVWLSPYVHHRAPAALGGVGLSVAVAARRRWPFAAVIAGVGSVAGQDVFGGHLTHHALGAIPAGVLIFYGAGAFLAARRSRSALGLGVTVLFLDLLLVAPAFAEFFFTGIMLCLLPWTVGRIMRERGAGESAERESAERLDAEREQRALVAASSERTRIARELHDVIAHSVSVMVIQAGGARTVMDSEPERAESSLRSVERAGREALAEMRRLLGVLDGGEDPRALAPQPGLGDVADLVSRTRTAGLETTLRVEGEPAIISPALDLCAYRIVQEALTNAIKHAGPARITVQVRWTRDALVLDVCDNGRGPVADNGSVSGHGIAGMRERTGLHGGHVQAGAGTNGGFAVQARLPLATGRVA